MRPVLHALAMLALTTIAIFAFAVVVLWALAECTWWDAVRTASAIAAVGAVMAIVGDRISGGT